MRRRLLHAWPRDRAGRIVSVLGASALLIGMAVMTDAHAIQGQLTTGVRSFTVNEGFLLHFVASVGILAGFTLLAWRDIALLAAVSGILTWIPAFAYLALRHSSRSPLLLLNGRVPWPGCVAFGVLSSFWICLFLAVLFWRHECRRWKASA